MENKKLVFILNELLIWIIFQFSSFPKNNLDLNKLENKKWNRKNLFCYCDFISLQIIIFIKNYQPRIRFSKSNRTFRIVFQTFSFLPICGITNVYLLITQYAFVWKLCLDHYPVSHVSHPTLMIIWYSSGLIRIQICRGLNHNWKWKSSWFESDKRPHILLQIWSQKII